MHVIAQVANCNENEACILSQRSEHIVCVSTTITICIIIGFYFFIIYYCVCGWTLIVGAHVLQRPPRLWKPKPCAQPTRESTLDQRVLAHSVVS